MDGYGLKTNVDNAVTFTQTNGKQYSVNKGDVFTFAKGPLDNDEIILVVYKKGKSNPENITVHWTYEYGEAMEVALATNVFSTIPTKADFDAEVRKNKNKQNI